MSAADERTAEVIRLLNNARAENSRLSHDRITSLRGNATADEKAAWNREHPYPGPYEEWQAKAILDWHDAQMAEGAEAVAGEGLTTQDDEDLLHWCWEHMSGAYEHPSLCEEVSRIVNAHVAEAVEQEKRRAAELGDRYYDVLDHEIAQAIRTDQEYVKAHNAALVREVAAKWPTMIRDMVSRGQVRKWLLTYAENIDGRKSDDE